jgi:hypothetical protein
MDLIEGIGPILGIVAFLGLVALVFALFQQGREVRRLREWAGRAPERADEAAAARLAAAEARGEAQAEEVETEPGERGRLAATRERIGGWVADRWRTVDRRLPLDGRYVMATIAAVLLAAVLLTSGFGLWGEDDAKRRSGGDGGGGKATVAVLNGTTVEGIQGVPQLAARVETEVVEPAGYRVGEVTNTTSTFDRTVVMFAPGEEDAAKGLSTAVQPKLGETPTETMSPEVETLAGPADLALVIGLDDSRFGEAG